jgi:hypothetical protein
MRIDLREIPILSPAAPAEPANLHLLSLFLVLNVTDVLLTHLNISMGFGTEGNPLLLLVIERFGWPSLYWFKVVGPLLLTLVILHAPSCRLLTSRQFSWFLALVCLVSLAGVCSGVWVSAATWSS